MRQFKGLRYREWPLSVCSALAGQRTRGQLSRSRSARYGPYQSTVRRGD